MNIDSAEFSVRLLADQEVIPRARTCARTIAEELPGTAVSVYLVGQQYGEDVWMVKGSAGDTISGSPQRVVPSDTRMSAGLTRTRG